MGVPQQLELIVDGEQGSTNEDRLQVIHLATPWLKNPLVTPLVHNVKII
jgi:hypothetical protein